jgi:hypothetical protein
MARGSLRRGKWMRDGWPASLLTVIGSFDLRPNLSDNPQGIYEYRGAWTTWRGLSPGPSFDNRSEKPEDARPFHQ